MIQIRFIRADGTEDTLQAPTGQSLMQAAVNANLHGIEADCGGALSCATCHVLLEPPWTGVLPAPTAEERDMLGFAASPTEPGSRLSCQIQLTPELDGLLVRLPAAQH
ncbi:MAG: 2Fe-2S iron-sulfur cluster-binding protein [Hydrogenophaga sp.]|jgi:2Fe-2S ferredoxin|nr:2Fe-2S iron-sulfur cluster-binding protein [Hydrogenophaga sp.]